MSATPVGRTEDYGVPRKLTLLAEGQARQCYLQVDDAQLPIVSVKPGAQAEGYKYAIVDAAADSTTSTVLCPCATSLVD